MAVWQPIDFHGIVTLNKSIVAALSAYIDQKETHLADLILHAVLPPGGYAESPILRPDLSGRLMLRQGVTHLQKNISEYEGAAEAHPPPHDWRRAVVLLDKDLWGYVESLEGVVTEFFQQLDQICFERWDSALISVVEEIKALLQVKIRGTIGAIKELEKLLGAYRRLCEQRSGFFVKAKRLFSPNLLDKSLQRNLVKAEKFLGFRYQTFMHRVGQLELLKQSTEQSIKKFSGYHVFNRFEDRQKSLFINLYQWLRIWELNHTTKSLPGREPVRAIMALQAPEKNLQFFKDYEKALREALFDRSRLMKLHPLMLVDVVTKIHHQHALQGQMAELHSLGVVVRKYRDFLLRTDPNPYIRSRLGFGERIVGPEPAISTHMMDLIFKIESLDTLFKRLMASVERADDSFEQFQKVKGNVERILHEMVQPLASYPLMLSKGKALVQELEQIDELGSTCSDVVSFVGEAFSRALRCDWKFHVFHEIPEFQQLFTIHQGIVGVVEDRSHLNRMRHFKKLIHQIQEWIKSNDAFRHLDEIDIEVSDLKGYLQDFLALAQRVANDLKAGTSVDPLLLRGLSNQLLEYRFLFGEFFHHLRRDSGEERVIRNQFLFVDQYFETIENKLFDLRD